MWCSHCGGVSGYATEALIRFNGSIIHMFAGAGSGGELMNGRASFMNVWMRWALRDKGRPVEVEETCEKFGGGAAVL